LPFLKRPVSRIKQNKVAMKNKIKLFLLFKDPVGKPFARILPMKHPPLGPPPPVIAVDAADVIAITMLEAVESFKES